MSNRSKELISSDEPLVERIAEEILERQRKGENPTVEEYCEQYPEHAEELRSFLPALMAVEGLKPNSKDVSGTFAGKIEIEGKRKEFIGDYRILRELGRGGMGVVYEAEQQSLGRHVALKVLLRSVAGDARAAKRFESEAKAAARMHHTNIVPVFDVGSDDEHLFYAMQLIQGQAIDLVIDDLKQLRNLRNSSSAAAQDEAKAQDKSIARSLAAGQFHQDQLLEQQQDSSPADTALNPTRIAVTETLDSQTVSSHSAVMPGQRDMSSAEGNRPAYFLSVARIGHQTAEALAYAHARGIIHRDIKPANLLLDGSGIVWITDFGLAKTGDHGMTHTGDILGTIRYMSPERFKGQCDVRADVYSLGLTLYELLTLQPAYSASDQLKLIDRIVKSEPPAPRALDASVPRDLETIVLKCIDKDPRRRYQSADELCEDLERFIHDEPIKARRVSLPERLARWSRRNKGMAAALAVAATLLLIINIAGPLVTWRMAKLKNDAQEAQHSAVEKANEAVQAKKDAEQAKKLADKQAADANHARRVADENAKTINRNLYFAKMNLASLAARTPGGMGRIIDLTDEWLPQPGRPDLRGWEWYYLRSLPFRGLTALHGHTSLAWRVAWIPDGKRLASVGRDSIKIWNPLSGETLQTLPGETNGNISWSPDGTRLVSLGPSIRIWNVDAEEVDILPGSGERWGDVAWAPDGSTIAISKSSTNRVPDGSTIALEQSSRIEILDAVTGKPTQAFEVSFRVMHLAWSPVGKRLALSGSSGNFSKADGHLAIWNTASTQLEGSVQLNGFVSSIAWNPQGTRISAARGSEREVTIWDVVTHEFVQSLSVPDNALSVDWSADGARIAAGLNNRMIIMWQWDAHAEQFAPLLHLESPTGRRITALAWSPDSKYISSNGGGGTVNIWDVEQHLAEMMEMDVESPVGYAHGICWKPDGSLLAVNAGTDTLRIWNMQSDELREFDYASSGTADRLAKVAISPDGRRLAAKTAEGIGIWDLETGQVQSWPIGRPFAISWSPFSKRLAATTYQDNGLVRIFNTETNSETSPLIGHKSPAWSFAWSPDGSRLASGGGPGEGTIRIWNVATGECEQVLPARGRQSTLAWSPDGCLASGDDFNNVILWDLNTDNRPKTLSGHVSIVQSVAWSPDGQRLASTGRGNRLIVWDPDSGLEAFSTDCPVNAEYGGAVSWSPDGAALAVISEGRVRILDASSGYAEQEKRLQREHSTIPDYSHSP